MKFVKIRSRWRPVPGLSRLLQPAKTTLPGVPPLVSRSNKPLAMNTEELLTVLVYYHIHRKLFLTVGKEAERPFVSKIVEPGQTVVLDRGYQAHHLFDQWQNEGCRYVCRAW